jgi:hypothetical protein
MAFDTATGQVIGAHDVEEGFLWDSMGDSYPSRIHLLSQTLEAVASRASLPASVAANAPLKLTGPEAQTFGRSLALDLCHVRPGIVDDTGRWWLAH